MNIIARTRKDMGFSVAAVLSLFELNIIVQLIHIVFFRFRICAAFSSTHEMLQLRARVHVMI
jgi:hypothetical protein